MDLYFQILSESKAVLDPSEEANQLLEKIEALTNDLIKSTTETLNEDNHAQKELSFKYLEDTEKLFQKIMDEEVYKNINYWINKAEEAAVDIKECLYGTLDQIKYIQFKVFDEAIDCFQYSLDMTEETVDASIQSAQTASNLVNDLKKELDACKEEVCYVKFVVKANKIHATLPESFQTILDKANKDFQYGEEQFKACRIMESARFSKDIFPIVDGIYNCITGKLE